MELLNHGILEKFKNCNYINNILFIFFRNTWSFFPPRIAANCLDVDKTNSVLYVGSDDGYLGIVNLNKNSVGQRIKGHEGAINAMGINSTNSYLYTVGSDGLLCVWQ
jgi:WD40 repeat protein